MRYVIRRYDALLNQTDIANNHNKYYIIQLLETDASPARYYCWNRRESSKSRE